MEEKIYFFPKNELGIKEVANKLTAGRAKMHGIDIFFLSYQMSTE